MALFGDRALDRTFHDTKGDGKALGSLKTSGPGMAIYELPQLAP